MPSQKGINMQIMMKPYMKKWYIIGCILAIVGLTISCSSPTPIPPAAISEIYAMSEAQDMRDYVEVKTVQDRGENCYIMIYIQPLSGEFTSLEDALPQATTFTRSFTETAVTILNKYDVNKDLSVWAQLPLEEGGVTVLGHAEYNAKEDTYHDFERHKP